MFLFEEPHGGAKLLNKSNEMCILLDKITNVFFLIESSLICCML